MRPNLSSFLNLSRWSAAFLVVIYHVRHLVLADFKDVVNQGVLTKALYFATGLGHEAVIVFFVISGFLVGGITLERWRARGPDLPAYASARVSRIYTVYLPALLVGLLLDAIGLHWFNGSELYTNSAQYQTLSLSTQVDAALDLPTFIGNLFMMQGILTGHFGSNGPLWSLANEWWYYCIFALAAAAVTGGGHQRVVCGLAAVLISALLPPKLMLWGLIWCLGIAAHAWVKSRWWRPHPWLGMGLFVLVLAGSRFTRQGSGDAGESSMLTEFTRDLVLGVAYVAALVSATRLKAVLPFERLHAQLAEFSYTAYLCHFPGMLLLVAMGNEVFGLRFLVQPDWLGLAYLVIVSGILCAYAHGFYLLTEKHTALVRRKLDAVFRPLKGRGTQA
ncbi:acyltransferase family protein [Aquabacterium sp.]|uniref:acyltransferase family protein n=1 Tax=Aquabacterium sp. TaxID=1872578 RepID=UPI003D6D89B1